MTKVRGLKSWNAKLGAISRKTRAEVHRALQRGAQSIADVAAAKIVDPPKTGKIYGRGTRGRKRKDGTWGTGSKTLIHQASSPGQPPAADTGRLDQSMTTVDASTGETIRFETGANAPYATPLELGSSKMKPRPFLAPSYEEVLPKVKEQVRLAVKRGAKG